MHSSTAASNIELRVLNQRKAAIVTLRSLWLRFCTALKQLAIAPCRRSACSLGKKKRARWRGRTGSKRGGIPLYTANWTDCDGRYRGPPLREILHAAEQATTNTHNFTAMMAWTSDCSVVIAFMHADCGKTECKSREPHEWGRGSNDAAQSSVRRDSPLDHWRWDCYTGSQRRW